MNNTVAAVKPVERKSPVVTAHTQGVANELARPPITAPDVHIQRKCACGGGCPACTGSAQALMAAGAGESRFDSEAGADRLMRQADAAGDTVPSVPAIVTDVLSSPGQPLDQASRSFMEPRFGRRFDRVRLHTGARAAESARAIHARAYTAGQDIVFGDQQYAPDTVDGRSLIAHELAHVVQQTGQSPGIQPKLTIGGENDPAEVRADRVTDAVMRGSPVPDSGRFSPVLRRRALQSCSRNVANIRLSESAPLYRVTRTRIMEPVTVRERPGVRVRPGINREDVFISIEWCRGSVGRVRIGGDIPAQALALLQQAAETITGGGGFQEVVDALRNTELTPFVDFDIGNLGNLRITGGVRVSVGRNGPTGGSGRIRIGTDAVTVGGNLTVGSGGEISGGVNVEIPLGRPGQPDVDCSLRERVVIRVRNTFRCEEFRSEHQVPHTINVPVQDRVVRTVFFDHARTTVNHALSDAELALLRQNLHDGFSVVRMEGFTSPEGRQGPPGAGTGQFQGNDQLSLDRVEAARALALAACPQGAADSTTGHCGIDDVVPAASGELLTLMEPTPLGGVREVEGRRLQSHAVSEFMRRDSERRYRTPEVIDEINRAPTTAARAEVVYKRLRRVEIELVRNRTEQRQVNRTVPAGFQTVACPDDVLARARDCFRVNDAVSAPAQRR